MGIGDENTSIPSESDYDLYHEKEREEEYVEDDEIPKEYQPHDSAQVNIPRIASAGLSLGERKDVASYVKGEMRRLGVHSGVHLSFSHITYTVDQEISDGPATWSNNMKRLLTFWKRRKTVEYSLIEDVSGYVRPGMLLLLLGPPGSGKTTLLDVLAGRKGFDPKKFSGDIRVNGDLWSKNFKRISGYVVQDDIHIANMTVRETLTFSSLLRNHPMVTHQKKLERVDLVLKLLGIDHVADTVVGGELLRGVSGGERKRVSIGIELVKGPSVLFLDEPTTGLDASAAYDVVKALRKLADSGIPVICSLLQPSQELFDLFDTVLVMSKRKCVYFGPCDKSIDHFGSAGFRKPNGKNTAEFLLDVCTPAGERYRDPEAPPVDLLAHYRQSQAYEDVGKCIWKGVTPGAGEVTGLDSRFTEFQTSMPFQTWMCFQRSAVSLWRNRRVVFARIIRAVLIGILISTLFWQLKEDELGANNRISLMYFCITFTALGSIASIPQVIDERRIFYHQRDSAFFRTISHFIASTVVDYPLAIFESCIFGTMVYWSCNLNYNQWKVEWWWGFLMFLLLLLALNVTAKQFCRLVSASVPTLGLATAVAPAILCAWLVFTGYLIPANSIRWWWIWMNWLCPFKYAFEGLSINEFGREDTPTFRCDADEQFPPPCSDVPTGVYICSGNFPFSCGNPGCPITDPEDELNRYALHTEIYWMYIDFGILWCWYILFCVGTYLSLNFLRFRGSRGSSADENKDEEHLRRASERLPTIGDDSTDGAIDSSEETKLLTFARTPGSTVNPSDYIIQSTYSDAIPGTLGSKSNGAYLSFKNINYSVDVGRFRNKTQLQLLYDINGYVPPGVMVALMGASGAGKSTLLDVLAERKTGGYITGEICVNGKPKDQFYARQIGYVEQSNVFLTNLTVKETLEFSCNMRLDSSVSAKEKKQLVEQVIRQLGLHSIQNTLVGTIESGISPEQRKKLSIGVELVARPQILFLDEPTSGLDSQAAENVMKAARQVTDCGVPVICTIHQPSVELFHMFDWLLLLKRGGRTIYFGPLGENDSAVLDYFAGNGLVCPEDKNPADFVLECSGAGVGGPAQEHHGNLSSFDAVESWNASKENDNVMDCLLKLNDPNSEANHCYEKSVKFASPYAVGVFKQTWLCIGRSFKQRFRQPVSNRSYLMTYFVLSLVLGTLYWQIDNTWPGARNRVALLYFSIIFSSLGAVACIPGLILQREVYYREKPAFLRPLAYYIAIVLAEIPLVLTAVIMFGVILYVTVGFNWTGYGYHFFVFLLIYSIASLTAVSYSMFMASIAATTEQANSLVGISLSVFALMAGFLIPKTSIPPWWIWLHYLSFFKYPLEALSINEMTGLTFSCPTNDTKIQVDIGNAAIVNGSIPVCNPTPSDTITYILPHDIYVCPLNGTDAGLHFISKQFGMNTQVAYMWGDAMVLSFFFMFFLFMVYIGIKFVNHLKR